MGGICFAGEHCNRIVLSGQPGGKSFVDGVYGLSRRDADFVFAAGSAVRFSACRLAVLCRLSGAGRGNFLCRHAQFPGNAGVGRGNHFFHTSFLRRYRLFCMAFA